MHAFEALAFAPRHPLIAHAARRAVDAVHEQAGRFLLAPRRAAAPRCTGAHSCLTAVSGPYAFQTSARNFLATTSNGQSLGIHRCPRTQKGHLCGFVRHHDCRNSKQFKRPCGSAHYTYRSHATTFFNRSVGSTFP